MFIRHTKSKQCYAWVILERVENRFDNQSGGLGHYRKIKFRTCLHLAPTSKIYLCCHG